jgi:uncharacterized protein YjbI with pentapeptide repeats
MANPQHSDELRRGVSFWNAWREANPLVDVDLRGADLHGARLSSADLSGADLAGADLNSADLSGVNLRDADLRRANLSWANMTAASVANANLQEANLTWATLCRADLSEAKLNSAKLINSNLTGIDASRASLVAADLGWANMTGAKLRRANMVEANLTRVDLTGADLDAVDFRSAKLQYARLDRAEATGIKLWETQRAGWSIKGIICARAFWGEFAQTAVEYGRGEFERLHSDQSCFELFYQGGVSNFELATLPAMLHHLSCQHPGASIRLKSIEETGGGARVSITVSDADPESTALIKADAEQAYRAQLTLRDNEIARLQIQREYLESFVSERLMKALLTAGAPQSIFNAPVTGVVISSGQSQVNFQQTVNQNAEAVLLLERMMLRQGELQLPNGEAAELTSALQSASRSLGEDSKDKSMARRSLDFAKRLTTEAVIKAAGKLGESAVSDWQTWLQRLGDLIHHLK